MRPPQFGQKAALLGTLYPQFGQAYGVAPSAGWLPVPPTELELIMPLPDTSVLSDTS